MTAPRTPRSLAELANVILLVREASGILDLEETLRADPEIQVLADRSYELLCDLRAKLESKHIELGFGWTARSTIEIRNKVEA
jgi:hypothetical protein